MWMEMNDMIAVSGEWMRQGGGSGRQFGGGGGVARFFTGLLIWKGTSGWVGDGLRHVPQIECGWPALVEPTFHLPLLSYLAEAKGLCVQSPHSHLQVENSAQRVLHRKVI
jgi:hypothetical protein